MGIRPKFSQCKDMSEAVMEGVQILQALRTCRICLDELREQDEIRALPCSHYFHKACIDRWLRINYDCPLCRNDMVPPAQPSAEVKEHNNQDAAELLPAQV